MRWMAGSNEWAQQCNDYYSSSDEGNSNSVLLEKELSAVELIKKRIDYDERAKTGASEVQENSSDVIQEVELYTGSFPAEQDYHDCDRYDHETAPRLRYGRAIVKPVVHSGLLSNLEKNIWNRHTINSQVVSSTHVRLNSYLTTLWRQRIELIWIRIGCPTWSLSIWWSSRGRRHHWLAFFVQLHCWNWEYRWKIVHHLK